MSNAKSPQQGALELFDTWVELPESERAIRISQLRQQEPALAAALDELLRAEQVARVCPSTRP